MGKKLDLDRSSLLPSLLKGPNSKKSSGSQITRVQTQTKNFSTFQVMVDNRQLLVWSIFLLVELFDIQGPFCIFAKQLKVQLFLLQGVTIGFYGLSNQKFAQNLCLHQYEKQTTDSVGYKSKLLRKTRFQERDRFCPMPQYPSVH